MSSLFYYWFAERGHARLCSSDLTLNPDPHELGYVSPEPEESPD